MQRQTIPKLAATSKQNVASLQRKLYASLPPYEKSTSRNFGYPVRSMAPLIKISCRPNKLYRQRVSPHLNSHSSCTQCTRD